MKTVKSVMCMIAYAILAIIRQIFAAVGTLFDWIAAVHMKLMRTLIEIDNDPEGMKTFNIVMDINANALKSLADKWYTDIKFEL